MAQAVVRWLTAQHTLVDGEEVPLFPGVFAIFGHGNVTCLGEALEAVQDRAADLGGGPRTNSRWRWPPRPSPRRRRRRQVMVCTSSIGPGATNMVTAAGLAHANRLPVLMVSGDTFANRVPDPVLQQVESTSTTRRSP